MPETRIEGYRLSPQQRRMWELRMQEDSLSMLYCVLTVSGGVQLERLRAAAESVVQRYELLRTRFVQTTGMEFPLQVVNERASVSCDHCDAAGLTTEAACLLLNHTLERAATRGTAYDLGASLHIDIIKNYQSNDDAIILSLPPLYADHCSLHALCYEISLAYAGEPPVQSPDELVQFLDLCTWLNEMIEGDDAEAGRQYWHRKVPGSSEGIVLLGEATRGKYSPATLRAALPEQLVKRISVLATQAAVAESTVFLTCWQALLWRLSRLDQITLGVSVSGRSHEGMEAIIGRLERQVPISVSIENQTKFWELLTTVEVEFQDACDWQEHYSWEMFERQGALRLEFGFSYDQCREDWDLNRSRWAVKMRGGPGETNKIRISCLRQGEQADIDLHYDRNVINEAQARRILGQYVTSLQSAAETDKSSPVSKLKIVGADERRQLIQEFNDTAVPHDHTHTVVSLIEEQARKSACNAAVESESESLSYAELDSRSNQLARFLQQKGVGPESVVGICMDRSPALIVGLLAILKAGGAYLPLDGSYPRARLEYMMEDSKAGVILTEDKYKDLLSKDGLQVIADEEWQEVGKLSSEPLSIQLDSNNLAYVIYTSGSTGQPKGVMVQHGSLSNHMQWMQAKYGLGKRERLLHKTTLCFDASVWEWLLPLMEGGVIVLARSGMQMDSRYLVRTIQQARITSIQVVPTMLRLLLKEKEIINCDSLERLFVGGEALTEDVVADYGEKVGKELINLYGPTETTVQMMIWERGWRKPVGIGRCISNVSAHVLTEEMELAGIGESGEICISGIALSRGYLNRPDSTAEKFIPDPFSSVPGSRLYRTRDLGGWRDDGILEFLGRIDDQVKIRGFRVELGEIEAAVRAYPEIKDTAVLVRDEEGGQKLVCYLVVEQNRYLDIKTLRQYLDERLPTYMVPGSYVRLDAMPLTPSGKLDKRSLPDPVNDRTGTSASVLPRTEMETAIAAVWSECLQIDSVGIQDNFFDVGGHSLLMIQVHNRLREQLGKDISIIDLFARPTIASLAEFLSNPDDDAPTPEDQSEQDRESRHSARRRRQARNAASATVGSV